MRIAQFIDRKCLNRVVKKILAPGLAKSANSVPVGTPVPVTF
jgi:hypothetical protein